MKTPREILLEFLPSLVQDIVHELQESGESLLDDEGVDEKVCQQIANDLVETLAAKVDAPRVLIVVEGGIVQNVICDKTIYSKIKDFDVFETESNGAKNYLAGANEWTQDEPVSQDEFNDEVIDDVEVSEEGDADVDSST